MYLIFLRIALRNPKNPKWEFAMGTNYVEERGTPLLAIILLGYWCY